MQSNQMSQTRKIIITAMLIGLVVFGMLIALNQVTANAAGSINQMGLTLTPMATCEVPSTPMMSTPSGMVPTMMATQPCIMPTLSSTMSAH